MQHKSHPMVKDEWDLLAEEWDRYIARVREDGVPLWMIEERMRILEMEDSELNRKLKEKFPNIDSSKPDS